MRIAEILGMKNIFKTQKWTYPFSYKKDKSIR